MTNYEQYEDSYFSLSQSYLALDECQCKGQDFEGMPSLSLSVSSPDDDSEDEDTVYYQFMPNQFELFPKVNKLLRTTYCQLALWNVDN